MNRGDTLRQQLSTWSLILGLWGLLVLGFASQLVFSGNLEWVEALRVSLRDWLPWAFLAPAVVWLSDRFPLERGQLLRAAPIQLAACVVAMIFCELVSGPTPGRPGYGLQPDQPEFHPPPDAPPPDAPPFFRPPDNRDRLPGGPRSNPQPGRPPMFRTRFNLPIYWALVSIAHALRFSRRSRERERRALELEARLADARLEALRMQLHPHFLFNTLNAISTLVHSDADAADEMIGNLSELLRAALDTGEQEIPLKRELAFLDRYLEIQQTRFGQRLRVEKAIDAATLEALVPTFILQPLVENAMRHGIEPRETPGLIRLEAHAAGELLVVRIQDNGAGEVRPRGESSSGIGLRNTQARLNTLYGESGKLVLTSHPEAGFQSELRIPFRTTPINAETAPENA